MKQPPSWFAVLMVLCGTILSHLFGLLPKETQVKTFCAYNRAFIEFTEGRNTWGTMMLDREGRPIPCSDDDDIKSSTNYNKEII
jgi:hypothetical protein